VKITVNYKGLAEQNLFLSDGFLDDACFADKIVGYQIKKMIRHLERKVNGK